MTGRIVATTLAILLLAGCGGRRDLRPAPGNELPPAAYGQRDRDTAAELLAPGPQARPTRNSELRTRSERRVADPFDLPAGEQPMGTMAPPAPAPSTGQPEPDAQAAPAPAGPDA